MYVFSSDKIKKKKRKKRRRRINHKNKEKKREEKKKKRFIFLLLSFNLQELFQKEGRIKARTQKIEPDLPYSAKGSMVRRTRPFDQ